jgi:hypothetical protein
MNFLFASICFFVYITFTKRSISFADFFHPICFAGSTFCITLKQILFVVITKVQDKRRHLFIDPTISLASTPATKALAKTAMVNEIYLVGVETSY